MAHSSQFSASCERFFVCHIHIGAENWLSAHCSMTDDLPLGGTGRLADDR